jgi:hypothetical protein
MSAAAASTSSNEARASQRALITLALRYRQQSAPG